MNVDDTSAEKYIKIYSFIDLDEIEKLITEHKQAPEKRILQKTLAKEVTTLIHGSKNTERVLKASNILFGEKISEFDDEMIALLSAEMPTSEMSLADVTSLPVADILTTS
jgi:tyrosyl-tRNA synthetase